MPFKTKKKKQSANKNRISLSNSGFLTYKNIIDTPQSLGGKHASPQRDTSVIDAEEQVRLRKELVKIFLLSSVIIGLQIALKVSGLSIFG